MADKSSIVLLSKLQNGDVAVLDILDPRSTLGNPIVDHSKITANTDKDEVFHRMMHKHITFMNKTVPIENNKNFTDVEEHISYDESEYEEPHIHMEIPTDISNKIVDKSIMQDMTEMYLSDDIKEKANEIYTKLEISTKRGGRRKKVVFFCLFQAHRELDMPCDPRVLAKTVGILPNDISKAFSMCSPIETGYYPVSKRFSFMDFIPTYYHLTGLSSLNLSDVEELGREILEKCPSIKDELPQTVAASILIYYMEINGVTCTLDFSKAVQRSEMTLIQMKKRIESIHNS